MIKQYDTLSSEPNDSGQPFLFFKNDKVIYHQKVLGRSYKKIPCQVISYNPCNPIRQQRVQIEILDTKEKIFVKDIDILPLNSLGVVDTRKRLYLHPESPYKTLHTLLDEYHLVPPLPVKTSIQTKLFQNTHWCEYTKLTIQSLIAIQNHGFIYLCTSDNISNNDTLYWAHINLFHASGELRFEYNYLLSKEDYESLTTYKELNYEKN